jgi:hypothetical protein
MSCIAARQYNNIDVDNQLSLQSKTFPNSSFYAIPCNCFFDGFLGDGQSQPRIRQGIVGR